VVRISVITVTYKNSKVVVDLLNSIQKYNGIGDELEVIIIDNSPENFRIEEAIKGADYKGYIYIPADNRGCIARWLGMLSVRPRKSAMLIAGRSRRSCAGR